MSERNVDALTALFHEKAVFVHMGGTMSKSQELDVIQSGRIHYKHAEILEVSVQLIGATAIVLNRIRLVAVVGGNEVTNPFVVTEVYVQQGGSWKLGSLSFTRLLTPHSHAPGKLAAGTDPAERLESVDANAGLSLRTPCRNTPVGAAEARRWRPRPPWRPQGRRFAPPPESCAA